MRMLAPAALSLALAGGAEVTAQDRTQPLKEIPPHCLRAIEQEIADARMKMLSTHWKERDTAFQRAREMLFDTIRFRDYFLPSSLEKELAPHPASPEVTRRMEMLLRDCRALESTLERVWEPSLCKLDAIPKKIPGHQAIHNILHATKMLPPGGFDDSQVPFTFNRDISIQQEAGSGTFWQMVNRFEKKIRSPEWWFISVENGKCLPKSAFYTSRLTDNGVLQGRMIESPVSDVLSLQTEPNFPITTWRIRKATRGLQEIAVDEVTMEGNGWFEFGRTDGDTEYDIEVTVRACTQRTHRIADIKKCEKMMSVFGPVEFMEVSSNRNGNWVYVRMNECDQLRSAFHCHAFDAEGKACPFLYATKHEGLHCWKFSGEIASVEFRVPDHEFQRDFRLHFDKKSMLR